MNDNATRRALVAGPFAFDSWSVRVATLAALVVITLLTQVGGLVLWPFAGLIARTRGRRRAGVLAGAALAYGLALFVMPFAAAPFGRVPLPCTSGALVPRSILFCVAFRNYVRPALRDEALAIADDVATHDADATVAYLDAGFPFSGLPMLPHLSHGDGARLDLALPFAHGTGSPIGYLGYAPLAVGERGACPPHDLDLRWDLDALQPLFGPPELDVGRASRLVRAAVVRPGIRRVLVEPHVARQLGVRSSKIAFQGCRAARHDDHIHLELAD